MADGVQCSMLRLSQEFLDTALQASGGLRSRGRCDSSDCLLCQGQRKFCSQAVTDHVCSWLGGRAADSPAASGVGPAQLLAHEAQTGESGAAAQPLPPRRSKRSRRGSTLVPGQPMQQQQQQGSSCGSLAAASSSTSSTSSSSGGDGSGDDACADAATSCTRSAHLLAGGRPWRWRPEYDAHEQPAPSRLVQVAALQPPAAGSCSVQRSDMVCAMEFSGDGQLLAAAGVSKQVALYSLRGLHSLQQPEQRRAGSDAACKQQQAALPALPAVALVRLPGKVSSMAWSPDLEGVLSVGDADGTLTQVHVASGHYLDEVDAHPGRRILSVSHSSLRPHLAATASDDCTAKLWAGWGLAQHVATIALPGSPAVCCAELCGWHEQLLALAGADARVRLYDLRRLQQPLLTLHGHSRPVSYAKFFGPGRLVSAGVDGTLALWELGPLLGLSGSGSSGSDGTAALAQQFGRQQGQPSCSITTQQAGDNDSAALAQPPQQQQQQLCAGAAPAVQCSSGSALSGSPSKVFSGHVNERNFVGLSVAPAAGLMAVGSEASEVVAYHTSWSAPLARFSVGSSQQAAAPAAAALGGSHCALQTQLAQPAAAAWCPPAPQRSVCAVAWQPVSGGCGRGCGSTALLAAATSAGECSLLSLQDA